MCLSPQKPQWKTCPLHAVINWVLMCVQVYPITQGNFAKLEPTSSISVITKSKDNTLSGIFCEMDGTGPFSSYTVTFAYKHVRAGIFVLVCTAPLFWHLLSTSGLWEQSHFAEYLHVCSERVWEEGGKLASYCHSCVKMVSLFLSGHYHILLMAGSFTPATSVLSI